MSAPTDQHPTADALRAFALGKLSGADAETVEAHVSTCASCADSLVGVPDDTLVQLARRAAAPAPKDAARDPGETAADPTAVPRELLDHPRYEVLGHLGSGGMGAVYKARHRLMDRIVALKVINRSLTSDSQAVDRFRREVKAAAKLANPNIVTAFDAEQAGDLHLLVMEFVDGVSLDRLVARQGPLSPAIACNLIRQAALGLSHAQEKGMIHRDIKPQNLMVTRKSQIKILDFGLARLVAEQAARSQSTGSLHATDDSGKTALGTLLGTPDYIAPEQVRNSSATDIRGDIYSLGCTLYFLLTGRPPFADGNLRQRLAAHLALDPAPVSRFRTDVPAEVEAVLRKMMAKDPADRFQSPAEVAKALAPLSKSAPRVESPATAPLATPLASAPAKPPAAIDWKRYWKPASIGLAILALLGCLVTFWPTDQPQTTSPAADRKLSSLQPGPIEPPTSIPPASQPALASQPAPATHGRVLFVVPSEQVWYADYGPVKQAFENAGLQVVTAAAATGRCSTLPDPNFPNPPTVVADLALTADVNANDYDALVFGGFQVRPYFQQGPLRNDVDRLIADFRRQSKVVSAICAGQAVLAHLGTLDGLNAAGGKILNENFPYNAPTGPRWTERPVEVAQNGLIITGRDDKAAAPFASAVLRALGK